MAGELVAKSNHFDPSHLCEYPDTEASLGWIDWPMSTWFVAVPAVYSIPILQPIPGIVLVTRSLTVLNTFFVYVVVRVATSIVPNVLITVLSLAVGAEPEAIAHT